MVWLMTPLANVEQRLWPHDTTALSILLVNNGDAAAWSTTQAWTPLTGPQALARRRIQNSSSDAQMPLIQNANGHHNFPAPRN